VVAVSRAKIVSSFSAAVLAAASALNLIAAGRMYPDAALAAAFAPNDIVNLIVAAAFIVMILAAKAGTGLFIGIDSAIIYMGVPLVAAYGLGLPAILPAAAVVAAIYGIVDRLKIEEVLAAEKAPIKREHLAYIALSILLGALFAARAAGVLGKAGSPAQDRMTAAADLALVAVWAVLIAISIINADKRVASLAGIMSGGAALCLSLTLYLIVEALARGESADAGSIAVSLALSLVFLAPAYRLLRIRKA
jgi:hypothetical protein